jgi:predicted murein hydrolase (TIGR00659 family)
MGKEEGTMKEMISNSLFFGVFISVFTYQIGTMIKKKYKLVIFNPLLVSIVLIIGLLLLFDVDYESYNNGAKYLSYLLTPATVCLAIPLYQQLEALKSNLKAIIGGVFAGVIAGLTSILLLSLLFGLNHTQYVTLLPKSITTAIGLGVSEELGGIIRITVVSIIITGISGNILAEKICHLFRIQDPIAKGLAIGNASHAIGTAKAIEIGEVEGAMSSLAIVIAGLLTVIFASLYATFM